MIEEIQKAFQANANKTGNKIVFKPEIKIKRSNDVLYISQVTMSKVGSLIATIEVFQDGKTDKAPMPVAALDDVSQNQILINLKK